MGARRNWSAIAGLLLGIAGVFTYFQLVMTYNPTVHRFLDLPWLNAAMIVLGLGLSAMGVRQAFRRTHRGRVLAPILAVLNVGLAGFFASFLVSSARLPEALRAPAIGSVAPDFALLDQQGKEVRLSSLRGRPVVLVFYRGHW